MRGLALTLGAALAAAALAPFPSSGPAFAAEIGAENFDSLAPSLQTRVDETGIPADLKGFTHTAPSGWTVTTLPAMEGQGMTEWRGWSFATLDFWKSAQTGQGREGFTKSSGVLAVAENDEWDDKGPTFEKLFESTLTSPGYDVSGKSKVFVNYDSHYRQTGPQVGALAVSFDGGAPQRLFEYTTATLGDQVYLENRTVAVPVTVPAGATSMKVSWIMEKATNDWYWAVDDISVDDTARTGAEPPLPPPPPGPEDVPDGISKQKVLFIDVDGLRYDKLLEANTPHIDALAARGQLGPAYIHDNLIAGTNSGIGHPTLLTGVHPDKHGSKDNNFTGFKRDQYPDLLTRLERVDPGYSTFSTLDWTPLNTYLIQTPDVKIQQVGSSTRVTDQKSTDDTVEAITTRNPDVLYTYLHTPDSAGHGFGHTSPEYISGIEFTDARIGELVAAVDAREAAHPVEDWLIVASTDHGMTGTGHGGDQHGTRLIWTLAAGGDVPVTGAAQRIWNQTDIATTIWDHLGLTPDPAWGWDGIPIGVPSTDPFDTLTAQLRGVVDEAAKPSFSGGWTDAQPTGWTEDDLSPATGVTEYRGWSAMNPEFWATSEEGQGRGSFVRGRDVVMVADADEWHDKAGSPDPAAAAFDSTLWSPWQSAKGGTEVGVTYLSHLWTGISGLTQDMEVVAEFDDGTRSVLWSGDKTTPREVSKPIALTTPAPAAATKVRIGWHIKAGNAGYWAIDAPVITAEPYVPPTPDPTATPEVELKGEATDAGQGWRATITVRAHAADVVLANARVKLAVRMHGKPRTVSCTTDATGRCTVRVSVRSKVRKIKVRATSVQHAAYATPLRPTGSRLVLRRP